MASRARRMRALRALRRERRERRRRRSRLMRAAIEAGADRGAVAAAPAARRGAQRARLRALGSRGQALGIPAYRARRPAAALRPSRPPSRCRSARPRRWRRPPRQRRAHPLLKVKLGGAGDAERLAAVRAAAPASDSDRRCERGLERRPSSSPISPPAPRPGSPWSNSRCPPGPTTRSPRSTAPCRSAPMRACMTRRDLAGLRGRYDAVNIKLDKAGGLTEALALLERSRTARASAVMVGCMVASSLAMAPAMLLAPRAQFRRSRRAAAAGARPPGRSAL